MSLPLVIVILLSCLCLIVLGLILGAILLNFLARRPKPGAKPSGCAFRLFPLRRPQGINASDHIILLQPQLGQVQLEIAPGMVNEIHIIPPQATTLSDDLCPGVPDQRQFDTRLSQPHLEDLTRTIIQTWPEPTLESKLEMLMKPGWTGKAYNVGEPVEEELEPFEPKDLEMCKHGLRKAWCAECQEEREHHRKRTGVPRPRTVNPFDLLLPFLYPPLGSNFDNAIVFPSGKELFAFQREGIRFLATHEAALLADEMGLGKSVQAIVAARLLFRSSDRLMDALIACPKSVLKDWERKLYEWAPELRTTLITGPPAFRHALWAVPSHVYLASYDTLRQDLPQLKHRKYAVVVLDEVQSIKSPSTQRTKAVRQIEGQRRWGLSATPMENKVDDLVGVFAYLKPGLLRYEDAKHPDIVKRKIEPYFLRRKVKNVRDDIGLGDKVSRTVWLELTPEQQETYDKTVEAARRSLSPVAREFAHLSQRRYRSSEDENEWRNASFRARGHALSLVSELKMICNFDPRTGESCKADFLIEKLEELTEAGEKALIFSQYPNVSLGPLKDRLSNFSPALFDGRLSAKERDKLIEQFQQRDEQLIMLMSLKAGGLGVTLTRANHVFHLDHWWNPAVAAQAVGRAYRIGQERPVFVLSLYVADTIEERIYRLLERKQELFREVIDDLSDEKVVGSLSTEELLELFDLVTFTVRLREPGRDIGRVIQVVSEVAQLEYLKAHQRVRSFPSVIVKDVSRQVAERAKYRLEAAGAIVEIQINYGAE